MRNCFIFGASRSGTSLLANMFSEAGYNCGRDLLKPSPLNPKGFFESILINAINDEMIRGVMSPKPGVEPWLSIVPDDARIHQHPYPSLASDLTEHQPFCYKDPRFSLTYPAWAPYLPDDTLKIILFRHPHEWLQSLRRGLRLGHWPWIPDDSDYLLRSWLSFYSHIFRNDDGTFVYMPFTELFKASCPEFLSGLCGASIPGGLADPKLIHGQGCPREPSLPGPIASIFRELHSRAWLSPAEIV